MAVVTVGKNNFDEEVMKSDKTVLIDFWASWCGPCQMLSPVVDEVAKEMDDIKVCKINIDEEPEISRDYRVMSIPMLVVIKNGEVTNKSVGVIGKSDIINLL